MKKHDIPTEHHYIPLGLFLLNCCAIHFLYVLFAGELHAVSYKLAVGAALPALIFTIARKSKGGILLASLFYLSLLLCPFLLP